MSDRRILAAIGRIRADLDLLEAELAGDATANSQNGAMGVEDLRRRCLELGIPIVDDTIDEAGAARLVDRSRYTLRNQRLTYGNGVPSERSGGRTRYRLHDIAEYLTARDRK